MTRAPSQDASFGAGSILFAVLGCALLSLAAPARAEPAAVPDKAARPATTSVADATDDPDALAKYGRLDARIRAAAQRDHLPAPVVESLIRIFSDEVDLRRAAQPGDGFVVVADPAATRSRAHRSRISDGGIVFAALTHGGQTERFYRFTSRHGAVGYFDESGRSAGKRLVRRPMRDGTLHGVFGMVRHPILGITKFHAGVDWQAPMGTPIYAAGPGTVEAATWDGAYGRRVRLRHRGGYETAYAHLSGFARGIRRGAHVRQGQLIGYVGSTGLATGTHLHYEVLVNGRFVDPLRIRLPAQHVLGAAMQTRFERQRERVDEAASRGAPFHAVVAQQ